MDFEVKNQKIRETISSKNNVVFDCIFLWVLGGFGEDFGRILGGFWEDSGRAWEDLGEVWEGFSPMHRLLFFP